MIATALSRFLDAVKPLPVADRPAAFRDAAIDSGGHYIPHTSRSGSSYFVEIQIHGIVAWGDDETRAIANWIHAAELTCQRIEADGFITVHPDFYTTGTVKETDMDMTPPCDTAAAPVHPASTSRAARLIEARGVIADCVHHDDAHVADACRYVIAQSVSATETARALDLLTVIEGDA